MIFGNLGRTEFGVRRHARWPSKLRFRQNLSKSLEHARHPFGGGGSKRFANAADLVNILEHNTMINVYIAPKYSQTLAKNQ